MKHLILQYTSNKLQLFLLRYWAGVGVATSCEKALDYYRRVATSVADEVSFSGGQTLQRVRLQVRLRTPLSHPLRPP